MRRSCVRERGLDRGAQVARRSSTPNARQTRCSVSVVVVSSSAMQIVSASTTRRLMRSARAAAASASALPGTRSATVSKNGSWRTSTPTRRAGRRRAALVSQCTRCAISRRPSGPWYTAYMPAMFASSTCAVQMLLVAFSRRMCCSRVCSASRSARATLASRPTRRPGGRAGCACTPRAWRGTRRAGRRSPSARRSAAPSRPRRRRPSPPAGASSTARAGRRRPRPACRCACRCSTSARVVADGAAGARVLQQHAEHALGGQVRRPARRPPRRCPSGSARVCTTAMVCGWQSRVDEEGVAALGVDPPQHRHRLGRGGGLVEQRRVGEVHAGEVATIVWKLRSTSSRPWEISGWYGV